MIPVASTWLVEAEVSLPVCDLTGIPAGGGVVGPLSWHQISEGMCKNHFIGSLQLVQAHRGRSFTKDCDHS